MHCSFLPPVSVFLGSVLGSLPCPRGRRSARICGGCKPRYRTPDLRQPGRRDSQFGASQSAPRHRSRPRARGHQAGRHVHPLQHDLAPSRPRSTSLLADQQDPRPRATTSGSLPPSSARSSASPATTSPKSRRGSPARDSPSPESPTAAPSSPSTAPLPGPGRLCTSIHNLSARRRDPLRQRHQYLRAQPRLRAWSPPSPACTTSASSRICAPASSSRSSPPPSRQSHFVAPGDIYTIYNVNPLLTTYTGAGVGTGANCHSLPAGTLCGDIAVTGQVDLIANDADVVAFRSASGLSTTNLPTTVHEGGDPGFAICNSCTTGPNESDLAESSIDVEWSGAMATGASILFVNGPDVFFYSMTQAIDQDLAPIITTSYGACEAGWGTTEMISLNTLFKQANAQGQTVLAAAADEGATDCDSGPTASEGLNASTSPAVRPTSPAWVAPSSTTGTALGATQYWSASNGTTGGSAVSYIPESVWNDEAPLRFLRRRWRRRQRLTSPSPPGRLGSQQPQMVHATNPTYPWTPPTATNPSSTASTSPLAVSCGSGYRVSSTRIPAWKSQAALPSTRRSSAECSRWSSRRPAPGSATPIPPSTPWAAASPTTRPARLPLPSPPSSSTT
jgi:hypothetical protein